MSARQFATAVAVGALLALGSSTAAWAGDLPFDELLQTASINLSPVPATQGPPSAPPAPRIAQLDLTRPTREIVNHVRALSPHIGARAVVDGSPLVVWKARQADDGSLELLEVQPEGRRRMTFDEYMRGRR